VHVGPPRTSLRRSKSPSLADQERSSEAASAPHRFLQACSDGDPAGIASLGQCQRFAWTPGGERLNVTAAVCSRESPGTDQAHQGQGGQPPISAAQRGGDGGWGSPLPIRTRHGASRGGAEEERRRSGGGAEEERRRSGGGAEEERRRSGGGAGVGAEPGEASPPSNPNTARSATLHGLSLRRLGFTIEQVVHHYGDVCQAVTELAHEQGAMVTIAEFQTLNGCLDNAIAAAVTSWNEGRDQSLAEGEARRDVFRRELLNLVDTATVALDALRAESDGAAAAVLDDCLAAMRSFLADSRWAAC
jgi:hypothetical protein